MTQVAIGLYGLQSWFGGDFAPVSQIGARRGTEGR